jgi:galactose mutarotase-like enzyme
MANITITPTTVQDFSAHTIANDQISFTIIPKLGGKLTSLLDRRTGREWLWTSSRVPYRRCQYGASYVNDADVGGWDECFPSVAATTYPCTPWQGVSIPDHGEIWSQSWPTKIIAMQDEQMVSIRMKAQGVALPYAFTRTIFMRTDSATLRFEYTLESQADADMPFIWSAHPVFALVPGMRVAFPDDARLHCYSSFPKRFFNEDVVYSWPIQFTSGDQIWDLAELPDNTAGFAFKVWTEPLKEGWASLTAPDCSLRFQFDTEEVPQLGLWVNAGGTSGIGGAPYYNMAFEPCIGAQDDLNEAVTRYGYFATLPAHGKRTWWLEVTLEVGS